MAYEYKKNGVTLDIEKPLNISNNTGQLAYAKWPNDHGPSSYEAFGKLMNCMEIDWGGAKYENNIDSHIATIIENGIHTSDELLSVLYWTYKTMNKYSHPGIDNFEIQYELTNDNNLAIFRINEVDFKYNNGTILPETEISDVNINFGDMIGLMGMSAKTINETNGLIEFDLIEENLITKKTVDSNSIELKNKSDNNGPVGFKILNENNQPVTTLETYKTYKIQFENINSGVYVKFEQTINYNNYFCSIPITVDYNKNGNKYKNNDPIYISLTLPHESNVKSHIDFSNDQYANSIVHTGIKKGDIVITQNGNTIPVNDNQFTVPELTSNIKISINLDYAINNANYNISNQVKTLSLNSATYNVQSSNYYYVYIEMASKNNLRGEELENKLQELENTWPPAQNQTYPNYELGWTRINEGDINNNNFNINLNKSIYTYTDEKDGALIIFPKNLKLYSSGNIDLSYDGTLNNHDNYYYYVCYGNPEYGPTQINYILKK